MNDRGALVGLLDEVRDRFDAQSGMVLTDVGYCNERDLSELEVWGIEGYVAPACEGRRSVGRNAGKHPATHRMVEKPAMPTDQERYAQRKPLSDVPTGRTREVFGDCAARRFNEGNVPFSVNFRTGECPEMRNHAKTLVSSNIYAVFTTVIFFAVQASKTSEMSPSIRAGFGMTWFRTVDTAGIGTFRYCSHRLFW